MTKNWTNGEALYVVSGTDPEKCYQITTRKDSVALSTAKTYPEISCIVKEQIVGVRSDAAMVTCLCKERNVLEGASKDRR
jgi:hypothetical protein